MKSAFYALNPLQADGRGQVAVCAGQPGKCFAFRIAVEMKNLPQSMNTCIRASGTGNLYGMGGDLAECVFNRLLDGMCEKGLALPARKIAAVIFHSDGITLRCQLLVRVHFFKQLGSQRFLCRTAFQHDFFQPYARARGVAGGDEGSGQIAIATNFAPIQYENSK